MEKGPMQSNIRKMYLVRMLSWTHFFAAVLVPFYTAWGGLRFAQILFLQAWFMFCVFLLEIPTGTVADFLGRKISMTIGSCVGVLGALIYASYPHYGVFLLAEAVFAVSFTLFSGADEALVYDTLKELGRTRESKKTYSRLESFKLAGIILGAASGSVIAKFLGLRAPMLLTAVPMGLCGLIAATLREPESFRRAKARPYRKILSEGVEYFFRNRVLMVLALDMVVVATFSYLILWFYQPLLASVGIDIVWFGMVHSMMCLAQIAVIANFLWLERLLGRKRRLLLLGAVVPGVLFILLGLVRSTVLVVAAIVLCAGFGLSREPLFTSYMNKYIPSDKRATVLSTTSMLRTLAICLANPVAGFLADWSVPATLVVVGCSILAFSMFSRIREEHLID
ncbi:MAG: MFS transporter [Candidatus Glassbacteria bacterium]|nr:MFS transporter [Candidatus Glassbacteria bacterium]